MHDPMANPKAVKDIIENPNAVYGYSPSPSSTRLKSFIGYDWTDPAVVSHLRQQREEYHESIKELYSLITSMKQAGASTKDIATAVCNRRNEIRLESNKDDPEALARVKQSNLATYGNENGGTPEFFYNKYGSWETVIEKALSTNAGADACVGLYDKYYDTYFIDNTDSVTPTQVPSQSSVTPTYAPSYVSGSSTGTIGSIASSSGSSGGGGGSGVSYIEVKNGSAKGYYTKIGKSSVEYISPKVSKKAKTVKVPATVKIGKKTYKVTVVSSYAFTGNDNLQTVRIGKNVKRISPEAFYGCKKLTKLEVGSRQLTAKTIRRCLNGSAVNKIVVQKRAQGKFRTYKKIFTKKITASPKKLSLTKQK